MKNRFKLKRWEMGVKQYQLASLLECSAPYLSMVENGRIEPTDELKEKAASVLRITVFDLFPEENS